MLLTRGKAVRGGEDNPDETREQTSENYERYKLIWQDSFVRAGKPEGEHCVWMEL